MIDTELTPSSKGEHDDESLLRECILGSESAWSALVDKYQNLVFSVPIKLGFSRDEAADVFQNVWVTLISQLSRIREPKTIAAWLIQVAAHECFQQRKRRARISPLSVESCGVRLTASDKLPDAILQELNREQILRRAVSELPPRCRELVSLLFFTVPPLAYADIAAELGLATGSIGFIRMRCLDKLRRELEEHGFNDARA